MASNGQPMSAPQTMSRNDRPMSDDNLDARPDPSSPSAQSPPQQLSITSQIQISQPVISAAILPANNAPAVIPQQRPLARLSIDTSRRPLREPPSSSLAPDPRSPTALAAQQPPQPPHFGKTSAGSANQIQPPGNATSPLLSVPNSPPSPTAPATNSSGSSANASAHFGSSGNSALPSASPSRALSARFRASTLAEQSTRTAPVIEAPLRQTVASKPPADLLSVVQTARSDIAPWEQYDIMPWEYQKPGNAQPAGSVTSPRSETHSAGLFSPTTPGTNSSLSVSTASRSGKSRDRASPQPSSVSPSSIASQQIPAVSQTGSSGNIILTNAEEESSQPTAACAPISNSEMSVTAAFIHSNSSATSNERNKPPQHPQRSHTIAIKSRHDSISQSSQTPSSSGSASVLKSLFGFGRASSNSTSSKTEVLDLGITNSDQLLPTNPSASGPLSPETSSSNIHASSSSSAVAQSQSETDDARPLPDVTVRRNISQRSSRRKLSFQDMSVTGLIIPQFQSSHHQQSQQQSQQSAPLISGNSSSLFSPISPQSGRSDGGASSGSNAALPNSASSGSASASIATSGASSTGLAHNGPPIIMPRSSSIKSLEIHFFTSMFSPSSSASPSMYPFDPNLANMPTNASNSHADSPRRSQHQYQLQQQSQSPPLPPVPPLPSSAISPSPSTYSQTDKSVSARSSKASRPNPSTNMDNYANASRASDATMNVSGAPSQPHRTPSTTQQHRRLSLAYYYFPSQQQQQPASAAPTPSAPTPPPPTVSTPDDIMSLEHIRAKCIRVYDLSQQSHIIDISGLSDPNAIREKIYTKFNLPAPPPPQQPPKQQTQRYELYVEQKSLKTDRYVRDSSIDDLTLLEICMNPDHPYRAHLVIDKKRHHKKGGKSGGESTKSSSVYGVGRTASSSSGGGTSSTVQSRKHAAGRSETKPSRASTVPSKAAVLEDDAATAAAVAALGLVKPKPSPSQRKSRQDSTKSGVQQKQPTGAMAPAALARRRTRLAAKESNGSTDSIDSNISASHNDEVNFGRVGPLMDATGASAGEPSDNLRRSTNSAMNVRASSTSLGATESGDTASEARSKRKSSAKGTRSFQKLTNFFGETVPTEPPPKLAEFFGEQNLSKKEKQKPTQRFSTATKADGSGDKRDRAQSSAGAPRGAPPPSRRNSIRWPDRPTPFASLRASGNATTMGPNLAASANASANSSAWFGIPGTSVDEHAKALLAATTSAFASRTREDGGKASGTTRHASRRDSNTFMNSDDDEIEPPLHGQRAPSAHASKTMSTPAPGSSQAAAEMRLRKRSSRKLEHFFGDRPPSQLIADNLEEFFPGISRIRATVAAAAGAGASSGGESTLMDEKQRQQRQHSIFAVDPASSTGTGLDAGRRSSFMDESMDVNAAAASSNGSESSGLAPESNATAQPSSVLHASGVSGISMITNVASMNLLPANLSATTSLSQQASSDIATTTSSASASSSMIFVQPSTPTTTQSPNIPQPIPNQTSMTLTPSQQQIASLSLSTSVSNRSLNSAIREAVMLKRASRLQMQIQHQQTMAARKLQSSLYDVHRGAGSLSSGGSGGAAGISGSNGAGGSSGSASELSKMPTTNASLLVGTNASVARSTIGLSGHVDPNRSWIAMHRSRDSDLQQGTHLRPPLAGTGADMSTQQPPMSAVVLESMISSATNEPQDDFLPSNQQAMDQGRRSLDSLVPDLSEQSGKDTQQVADMPELSSSIPVNPMLNHGLAIVARQMHASPSPVTDIDATSSSSPARDMRHENLSNASTNAGSRLLSTSSQQAQLSSSPSAAISISKTGVVSNIPIAVVPDVSMNATVSFTIPTRVESDTPSRRQRRTRNASIDGPPDAASDIDRSTSQPLDQIVEQDDKAQLDNEEEDDGSSYHSSDYRGSDTSSLAKLQPSESYMDYQRMFAMSPDTPRNVNWIKGPLIGAGSFGKVYYGVNCDTGEIMAVKQVQIRSTPTGARSRTQQSDTVSIASQDDAAARARRKMLEALHREILLLKDLDHENIVRYLGFDVQDQYISVFLEYVSGGSVASALAVMGNFDELLVRSIVSQVLSGLEYLHDRFIIHRDIKGGNILIDEEGWVKISDFGISKKSKYQMAYRYNSRMSIQGSVYWMAPEVVKAKGYSAKVDIWSLGCVVLEMFTGVHPWQRLDEIQTMWRLGREDRPPMPDDLSPEATDFLSKCFTVQPESRPTASELLLHPFSIFDPTTFDFRAYKIAAIQRKQMMDEDDDDDDDDDYDDDEMDEDDEEMDEEDEEMDDDLEEEEEVDLDDDDGIIADDDASDDVPDIDAVASVDMLQTGVSANTSDMDMLTSTYDEMDRDQPQTYQVVSEKPFVEEKLIYATSGSIGVPLTINTTASSNASSQMSSPTATVTASTAVVPSSAAIMASHSIHAKHIDNRQMSLSSDSPLMTPATAAATSTTVPTID